MTFTPETARAAGQRSAAGRRRQPAPAGSDRLAKHLRDLVDAARGALRAHRDGGAIATALGHVDKALRRAEARLILDRFGGPDDE